MSELQIPDCARELFGLGLGAAVAYTQMLAEAGPIRGLIGPREAERLWERHVINSLALSGFLPPSGKVMDVGSGGGLPGIPLAIIRPDLEFHLIESMGRRVDWLHEVREELDLDNVVIHHGRAEDMPRRLRGDVVTARAVGSLVKLLPWCGPLVAFGGRLAVLKGQSVFDEISASGHLFARYGLSTPVVDEVINPVDASITRVLHCTRSRR